MSCKDVILVLTGEADTVSAINGLLATNGNGHSTVSCQDVDELTGRLEQVRPAVVLVDIDPCPERMLPRLDAIVSNYADTRFMLLTRSLTSELMRDAMRIGARDVLDKPNLAADLPGALHRALSNGKSSGQGRGVVITFLAASGGCGSTTLSVNFAYELRPVTGEAPLVVDLDYTYGAIGRYLGLEGQYGIADVIADEKRIDSHLVRSTASTFRDELHVLLSPASTGFPADGMSASEHLAASIEACRSAYRYTVIDAPRVPQPVAALLARKSFLTAIVCQLTVKDLHVARAMRAALQDQGVGADRVRIVANRYRKRHAMINLKEAERILGATSVRSIRNDYRSAIRSLNYGEPIAKVAPRSPLRQDLRQMATELAAVAGNGAQQKEWK